VIPDSCRSNFLPFYHHPPYAFLLPRSLSRRRKRSPKLPCPSRVGVRFWASLYPTQARQCIWPYRVQHCFVYGLAVHLRLPPTPSFDDAVSFDYGQPVFCPMGTFTPLLVRTLRRTQGCAPARPAWHAGNLRLWIGHRVGCATSPISLARRPQTSQSCKGAMNIQR
jgi:hypothetical protein